MSQESVNTLLSHIGEVGLDAVSTQSGKSLPEYAQLSADEKNALAKLDVQTIKEFLTSASTRRANSRASVQQDWS